MVCRKDFPQSLCLHRMRVGCRTWELHVLIHLTLIVIYRNYSENSSCIFKKWFSLFLSVCSCPLSLKNWFEDDMGKVFAIFCFLWGRSWEIDSFLLIYIADLDSHFNLPFVFIICYFLFVLLFVITIIFKFLAFLVVTGD